MAGCVRIESRAQPPFFGPGREGQSLKSYRWQVRGGRFLNHTTCSGLPPGSVDNAETEKENKALESEQELRSGTEGLGTNAGDSTKKGASRSSTMSLDSYFTQLEKLAKAPPSSESNLTTASSSSSSSSSSESIASAGSAPVAEAKQTKDQKALKKLEAYFDMLNPRPAEPVPPPETPPPPPPVVPPNPAKEKKTVVTITADTDDPELEEAVKEMQGILVEFAKGIEEEENRRRLFDTWQAEYEERRAPFVVNVMVAINIGVFLLELSTVQQIPGEMSTSLPNLYFAKVNNLIEAGEWWRLITAMFLHDGFLHLLGSTWVLLSLGPVVETAYGPLGFFLSYFIGGLFGNLISFTETPAITVGGTGPLYGVVAAWVVFLLRNRTAIGEECADDFIRTAVILGILNIVLPVPLPIDNWTHIGGALGGVLYASLATPELVRVPISRDTDAPEEDDEAGRSGQGGLSSNSDGPASPSTSRPDNESWRDAFGIRREVKPLKPEEGLRLETRDIGVLKKVLVGALCLGVFASLFQATIGLGELVSLDLL